MSKVRLVSVQIRQSHYVGDVAELESLIEKGYEIKTATSHGDFIIYTLVRD